MAKTTSAFVCQQCGSSSPKWYGKCPQCGAWGSLVETLQSQTTTSNRAVRTAAVAQEPVLLSQVAAQTHTRVSTGMYELDRVLGGGIVPGMAVLIAGEPGIGKSTLLLELAARMAKSGEIIDKKQLTRDKKAEQEPGQMSHVNGRSVLYVAGEESPEQIKLRAKRLGVGDAKIALLSETDVDVLAEIIPATKPAFVIIDSIQTLSTQELTSQAGSVGQVRECVDRLTALAKRSHIPTFFVGHITREGTIAGPKTIEHIVDTVLLLEGDQAHNFRMLRAQKNRFGSTDEVGVFTMEEDGLREITNASEAFIGARLTDTPGSVVVPTMEGTRTILVEVQALTAPTTLAMPRRVGIGIEFTRLQFLLALLSTRLSTKLAQLDVFVNVVGGLKVSEPALDLGICLAVASSFTGIPLDKRFACFGEVGLLGEIRPVRFTKQRKAEAKRLGYTTMISNEEVRSLSEAIAVALKQSPKAERRKQLTSNS